MWLLAWHRPSFCDKLVDTSRLCGLRLWKLSASTTATTETKTWFNLEVLIEVGSTTQFISHRIASVSSLVTFGILVRCHPWGQFWAYSGRLWAWASESSWSFLGLHGGSHLIFQESNIISPGADTLWNIVNMVSKQVFLKANWRSPRKKNKWIKFSDQPSGEKWKRVRPQQASLQVGPQQASAVQQPGRRKMRKSPQACELKTSKNQHPNSF